MPPIKGIDLSDGIRIIGSGVPSIDIKFAQFPMSISGSDLQFKLVGNIGRIFEDWVLLKDLEREDPLRQKPPIFDDLVRQRLSPDDKYIVTTKMFIKLEILNYPPTKEGDINVICSDFPID